MSPTTAVATAPTTAVNPFKVDDELDSIGLQLDLALDDLLVADSKGTVNDHDAAMDALKILSNRRTELESLWERHGWLRFYQDAHGSVHIDRDCYAASKGDMKLLPELSGKTVGGVRAIHGSGRTCKMCSHGVD